jgi:hypothetical protein
MGAPENMNAAAIVGKNELREVLNARKAETDCSDRNELVVCAALDKLSSRELSHAERKTLLQMNIMSLKVARGLPGYVMLFEGMPVILRLRNLSTDLGITNGSQGVVRKIFTATCPAGFTYASCVLVEFPHSKKRARTSQNAADCDLRTPLPLVPSLQHTPATIQAPSAGCKWSPLNWSCAYDSVFMVCFYIYREASPHWRNLWSDSNYDSRRELAVSFRSWMESEANLLSQDLFDRFRDKLRDLLSH